MITADIRQFIDASVLCWLATVTKDSTPNVSPKQIFTAYGDQHLLIANIASPGSVRNVKAVPDVCVSFVDIFVGRGYKLIGTAEVLGKNDPGYEELHAPLFELASADYPILSILKIRITRTEPINAPSYKLFPERTDAERTTRAMDNYGVQPK